MKHVSKSALRASTALVFKGDDEDPASIVTRALGEFSATFEKKIGDQIKLIDDRLREVEPKTEKKDDKTLDQSKLQERIDKLEAKMARRGLGAGGAETEQEQVTLVRKALTAFAGSGDDTELKSLSVGSDPDGGFLVLPTLESGIRSIARDVSPIRALASTVTIGTDSYEILVDDSDVDSGWVDEKEERPETDGPSLKKVSIPVHETYAAPRATQKIIDDASLDVGAWLEGKIGDRFSRNEALAFSLGDGIDRPKGYLTYPTAANPDFTRPFGTFQYVAAGSTTPSDVQVADALIKLSLTLRTPYRANATWVMGRDTAIRLRQIKDTTGNYIWAAGSQGLQGTTPDRLLGFPVAYDDAMSSIASGNISVALGDWKQGYQVVDRIGIRVVRDPYTAKPYVIFYATKRVGGGAVDTNAIKFLKISAS